MSKKEPYKEPEFLFTSSSMRQAAYAGWYSALGDKEKTQMYIHSAHVAWTKEVSAGRRYVFADRFNDDIYRYIDFDILKSLTDEYLKKLNKEINKVKKKK